MKRYLAVLVCLLVGTSAVAEARQITFGGRIGLNSATFGGEDTEGWDKGLRTGIVAGVHLRVPLAGGVLLQPELLYSQRGATSSFGETLAFAYKLDYIELPVLVRYDIPLVQAVVRPAVFTVFIGPSFAFEMSCKETISAFGESETIDCDENEHFDRNKLDMGLAFGGGFDFPMSFGTIVVDGRYLLGLRTIYSFSQHPVDIKHRVWAVSAGIAIPLGRR